MYPNDYTVIHFPVLLTVTISVHSSPTCRCNYKCPFFAKMQILGKLPQRIPAFSLSNQKAFILTFDKQKLPWFFLNVYFTNSW